MSKHTLEQVLEALINKEDDRATELLHRYFVAKGKSIYEELSQLDQQIEEDEDLEEGIGGAADQDFHDEIIADESDLENETLFSEADDEGEEEGDDMAAMDEPTEPEATADLAMGGEEAGEEGGEADQVDDAMAKVDDALAELKALFAEITGGEAPAMDADMPAEEPATEEFEAFGESATLKAVPAPTHGDNGQNTKSPVSTGPKISGNGAKAVDFTGQADGKGGTQGGVLNPSTKEENFGNVNKVGNAKAPALKSVAAPKSSDAASNKTSPVAKN